MLNLKQILEQKRILLNMGVAISSSQNSKHQSIKITFLQNGIEIGILEAEKLLDRENNVFYVNEAECDLRGFGKLLYYEAMNAIYPNWLAPGRVVSHFATRVWLALYQTNQTMELENWNGYGDLNENGNSFVSLNNACRFSYK